MNFSGAASVSVTIWNNQPVLVVVSSYSTEFATFSNPAQPPVSRPLALDVVLAGVFDNQPCAASEDLHFWEKGAGGFRFGPMPSTPFGIITGGAPLRYFGGPRGVETKYSSSYCRLAWPCANRKCKSRLSPITVAMICIPRAL